MSESSTSHGLGLIVFGAVCLLLTVITWAVSGGGKATASTMGPALGAARQLLWSVPLALLGAISLLIGAVINARAHSNKKDGS